MTCGWRWPHWPSRPTAHHAPGPASCSTGSAASGALAGHPIGNLLLTGLMELHTDPVTALDELARLVGAHGRVLPMAVQPLDLIAEVASVDRDDPVQLRRIRGQSAIAATAGRVTSITLVPPIRRPARRRCRRSCTPTW